ncbi:amidase family protein [Spiroplasma platyhelix]|uniref:Asp-tRNA(Asn)/Glu-tRNA(Gln) amidotransferase subunit GatA n=1 Tax=Spiroplasma platyhelix PALS-1 TaxID=1276218 RepID=A0A846U3X1_9MOLU|nr:amidase family protein [Spiroplasma platyhelix]MBE4703804.1 Glutamyl-tRNA(Gln) amidotransferase subunit A [Spiroplasma platyhelix PALS-1]NKE38177.1 Asp-tRNA(Asn)/Glu-tRNA(Gln) amidotransferase subunit GatA [Spiroplasma platyhelix PALS-1]UJB29062.1 aspartyl/glutamyl-tRNA amidotransferase subunit A [Spiroplasma platyhelix PALS-1]
MKKINYQQLSIMQLHELLVNKTLSAEELLNLVLSRLKKFADLNAVATVLEKEATEWVQSLKAMEIEKDNPLYGIPFVMKDNIITIGQKTTASSNILANFVPHYDSTINSLLKNVKAVNIAKTALDELGMGGDGLYANTGYVYNPWNKAHIIGGSSSGSTALVAAGVVPFALGTDTGDSIRKPAGFNGIVGFKPTYGLISRNGVIPYAPSLDTVGIFANYVQDIANVLDVLVKEDKNDFTNTKSLESDYFKNLKEDVSNLKIAVLNYQSYQWKDEVKSAFDQAMKYLVNGKAKVEYIDFNQELLSALLPVYMIISFAEATSCHAGYDGVNFGVQKKGSNYQETMIKSRTAGFGQVVKRRYVIGAYALSELHQKELFLKAKRVRRIIVEQINQLLANYDAFIVMPSVSPAPTIKDVLEKNNTLKAEHQYMEDLLVLANLNGSPSITIPLTIVDELPIGLNINTAPFKDQTALNIANYLSKQINFKNKLLGEDDE